MSNGDTVNAGTYNVDRCAVLGSGSKNACRGDVTGTGNGEDGGSAAYVERISAGCGESVAVKINGYGLCYCDSFCYGAVAKKSATTLLRSILTLEDQGGDLFFGEPALELSDFMQCNDEGKGMINVLDSVKLSTAPELYSTFLLWMISELYQTIGEPHRRRKRI